MGKLLPVKDRLLVRRLMQITAASEDVAIRWLPEWKAFLEHWEVPEGSERRLVKNEAAPAGKPPAPSIAAECPQGHHLKEGQCRPEYCLCRCARCDAQCRAGRWPL